MSLTASTTPCSTLKETSMWRASMIGWSWRPSWSRRKAGAKGSASTTVIAATSIRVYGIAQAVAQRVEGKDGDQYEADRRQDPGIGADDGIGRGVLQHQAPRDQRRLDREAEEAEEGFQEHHRRDRQCHGDDHVAHHIGEDVLHDDAPVGCADRHGGAYIFDPRQRQRLAAHLARHL